MREPLKKCGRCGFAMHEAEYECVKCQVLDAQEIQLKRDIATYYKSRYPHLRRQRYTYLTDPADLQGWADGSRAEW